MIFTPNSPTTSALKWADSLIGIKLIFLLVVFIDRYVTDEEDKDHIN